LTKIVLEIWFDGVITNQCVRGLSS